MYLDTQYHSDLTVEKMEGVLYVKEHTPCRMLSKFTFEKGIEVFATAINQRKIKWLVCSYNFSIYRHI